MDTTPYVGSVTVGGSMSFPDFASFTNQPQKVQAEQINARINNQSTILATASVATQVTGVFINGINTTYPGVISTGAAQNPAPQAPIQEGFTGTVGG